MTATQVSEAARDAADDRAELTAALQAKVQAQAVTIQAQSQDLTWAADFARVCEETARSLDPTSDFLAHRRHGRRSCSPSRTALRLDKNPPHVISMVARHRQQVTELLNQCNKLERRAVAAEKKGEDWQRLTADLRKANLDLEKKLSVVHVRSEKLQRMAAASDEAIARKDEAIRKLEFALDSSERGQAALKAAECELAVARLQDQVAAKQRELDQIEGCLRDACPAAHQHTQPRGASLLALLRGVLGAAAAGSQARSAEGAEGASHDARVERERHAVAALDAQLLLAEAEARLADVTRERDALLDHVFELQEKGARPGASPSVHCESTHHSPHQQSQPAARPREVLSRAASPLRWPDGGSPTVALSRPSPVFAPSPAAGSPTKFECELRDIAAATALLRQELGDGGSADTNVVKSLKERLSAADATICHLTHQLASKELTPHPPGAHLLALARRLVATLQGQPAESWSARSSPLNLPGDTLISPLWSPALMSRAGSPDRAHASGGASDARDGSVGTADATATFWPGNPAGGIDDDAQMLAAASAADYVPCCAGRAVGVAAAVDQLEALLLRACEDAQDLRAQFDSVTDTAALLQSGSAEGDRATVRLQAVEADVQAAAALRAALQAALSGHLLAALLQLSPTDGEGCGDERQLGCDGAIVAAVTDLVCTSARLQEERAAAEAELNSAARDRDELGIALARATHDMDVAAGELVTVQARLDQANAALRESAVREESLQARLQESQAALRTAEQRVAELSVAAGHHRSECERLQTESHAVLEAAEADFQALSALLAAAQQDAKAKSDAVDALTRQAVALQATQATVAQLESELQRLKVRLHREMSLNAANEPLSPPGHAPAKASSRYQASPRAPDERESSSHPADGNTRPQAHKAAAARKPDKHPPPVAQGTLTPPPKPRTSALRAGRSPTSPREQDVLREVLTPSALANTRTQAAQPRSPATGGACSPPASPSTQDHAAAPQDHTKGSPPQHARATAACRVLEHSIAQARDRPMPKLSLSMKERLSNAGQNYRQARQATIGPHR